MRHLVEGTLSILRVMLPPSNNSPACRGAVKDIAFRVVRRLTIFRLLAEKRTGVRLYVILATATTDTGVTNSYSPQYSSHSAITNQSVTYKPNAQTNGTLCWSFACASGLYWNMNNPGISNVNWAGQQNYSCEKRISARFDRDQ